MLYCVCTIYRCCTWVPRGLIKPLVRPRCTPIVGTKHLELMQVRIYAIHKFLYSSHTSDRWITIQIIQIRTFRCQTLCMIRTVQIQPSNVVLYRYILHRLCGSHAATRAMHLAQIIRLPRGYTSYLSCTDYAAPTSGYTSYLQQQIIRSGHVPSDVWQGDDPFTAVRTHVLRKNYLKFDWDNLAVSRGRIINTRVVTSMRRILVRIYKYSARFCVLFWCCAVKSRMTILVLRYCRRAAGSSTHVPSGQASSWRFTFFFFCRLRGTTQPQLVVLLVHEALPSQLYQRLGGQNYLKLEQGDFSSF